MAGKNDGQSNTRKAEVKETEALAQETKAVQESAKSPILSKALSAFCKSGKARLESYWTLAVVLVAEFNRGWTVASLASAAKGASAIEVASESAIRALLAMPDSLAVLVGWGMDETYLRTRFEVSLWIPISRVISFERSDKCTDKAAFRESFKALLNGDTGFVPSASTIRDFLKVSKGNGKSGNVTPIENASAGEGQTLDVSKATEGALCELIRSAFARAKEIGPEAVAKLAETCAKEIEGATVQTQETEVQAA